MISLESKNLSWPGTTLVELEALDDEVRWHADELLELEALEAEDLYAEELLEEEEEGGILDMLFLFLVLEEMIRH